MFSQTVKHSVKTSHLATEIYMYLVILLELHNLDGKAFVLKVNLSRIFWRQGKHYTIDRQVQLPVVLILQ